MDSLVWKSEVGFQGYMTHIFRYADLTIRYTRRSHSSEYNAAPASIQVEILFADFASYCTWVAQLLFTGIRTSLRVICWDPVF